MTAYPVQANLGHWWLTTPESWSRLHAVPGAAVNPRDDDAVDVLCGPGMLLRSVCGQVTDFTMPGVLSALGLPRCGSCCRVLGIDAGAGTPANSDGVSQASK